MQPMGVCIWKDALTDKPVYVHFAISVVEHSTHALTGVRDGQLVRAGGITWEKGLPYTERLIPG